MKKTNILKKGLPWVIVVGIFYILFKKHNPDEIYNALLYINYSNFIPVVLGYFIIMFGLDTFSIRMVLARFGYPQKMIELLPARGLTYLLMILNYAAAQAAFAYYQYRKNKLPIAEMFGIFGVIVFTDFYLLVTLAYATTFFTTWSIQAGGMGIADFIRVVAYSSYAIFIVNIIFWKFLFGKFRFSEKLKKKKIIEMVSQMKIADYFSVAAMRLPVHTFIMAGMYFAFRTFSIDIKFVDILANIPIAFFVGSLPITPGGLGTTNAMMVKLFEPLAGGPLIMNNIVSAGTLILSFSLVWMLANSLLKAVTSMICLKFVSKDLFKPVDIENSPSV